MEDEEDVIVATLSETLMYKVPPLRSAEGYKAQDWNGHHFMSGSTVILERGSVVFIQLKDDSGNVMVEVELGPRTVTSSFLFL